MPGTSSRKRGRAAIHRRSDRYRLVPPPGTLSRYRLQQWLSFIGTELHKAVSIPLLDRTAPDGAKTFAREKAGRRMAYLGGHLTGRDYLLDTFTVADAYLVTVLNCRH